MLTIVTPKKATTIKLFSFSLQGTHPILQEQSHIKDVLSRIVVEMIKREWPQHWPDMLKEMETLTSQGVSFLFPFRAPCGHT